jgi:hypothetical protein
MKTYDLDLKFALQWAATHPDDVCRPMHWKYEGKAITYIPDTGTFEVIGLTKEQFPSDITSLLIGWEVISFEEFKSECISPQLEKRKVLLSEVLSNN